MTTEAKWFAALFIGVMWTAVSVVAWPRLALHLRLRASGEVTEGEVVTVDARDHNRATYRYTVGSNVYANSEVASHRRVGAKVRVFYCADDPSVSMLREPSASLIPDVLGLVILYALIAVAAIFMASRSRRGAPK